MDRFKRDYMEHYSLPWVIFHDLWPTTIFSGVSMVLTPGCISYCFTAAVCWSFCWCTVSVFNTFCVALHHLHHQLVFSILCYHSASSSLSSAAAAFSVSTLCCSVRFFSPFLPCCSCSQTPFHQLRYVLACCSRSQHQLFSARRCLLGTVHFQR